MTHCRFPAFNALLCASLSCAASTQVQAQDPVRPVGPFVGQASESFDRIISTSFRIRASIEVLGGDVTFATMLPPPNNTTIHLWFGSCFSGDCAIPRSPNYLIGATSPQAIVFNRPVTKIGAYFTNTSGRADATASFYDTAGGLLESEVVSIPAPGTNWYWNGWESDVPLGRIEIVGNGVLQGFIWLDDLEVEYATAASCAVRNGSGVNPVEFACQNRPVLGTSWQATVAPAPTGQTTVATTIFAGLNGPTSGTLFPFGELLVLTPLELDTRGGASAGQHAVAVPALPSLSGVTLFTQAARLQAPAAGPNQLVLLNAIDLVLGF